MFAVIYNAGGKDIFASSNIIVGHAYIVVKPQLDGEWNNLRILKTGEPLLPESSFIIHPYFELPFPTVVSVQIICVL